MAKYNSDIRMYQAALQVLKDGSGKAFYDGSLDGDKTTHDGVSGRNLSNAIKAFEKENGLPVIGNMDINKQTFQTIDGMLTPEYQNMVAMETKLKNKEVPVFSCDDSKLNLDVFDPATLPLPMHLSAEIFQRIVQLKKVSKFPVRFKESDCDINAAGNFTIYFKFKDIKWLKKGPSFDTVMPWPAKNEIILELGTTSKVIWQYDDTDTSKHIVKSEKKYPYLVGLPTYDSSKHPAVIGLKSGVTHVVAQKSCVSAALHMKGGARYKDDATSEKIFIELTSIVTGLDTKLADALKALGKSVRAKNTFGGFPLIKFKNCNKTNSKLLTFLIKAEGKHLDKNGKHIPYEDDTGNCTIGYGRFLHSKICTPADLTAHGGGINESKALSNLAADIKNKGVDTLTKIFTGNGDVLLTQPMYDALVSMAFNLKRTSHKKMAGNLLDFIKKGEYQEAANNMLTYNGGKSKLGKTVTNRGLTNRRVADRNIFLYGRY